MLPVSEPAGMTIGPPESAQANSRDAIETMTSMRRDLSDIVGTVSEG